MNFFHMILLAVIQGITEFIPVSSSGHLVIFQAIMDIREPGLTLEVMLHVGTLMAVLVIFRSDIKKVIKGLFSLLCHRKDPYGKLALYILIASLPAGVVGLTLYSNIVSLFSTPVYAYIFLLFNGVFLSLNRFWRDGKINLPDTGAGRAFIIGMSQVVTMLPGISRSGTTITTGILLKMKRESAARFSFLMSIPAVAGAAFYEAKNISSIESSIFILAAGIAVSFLSGYIAIKILLKVILAKKLHYFGYYCILAAAAGLLFLT